MSDMATLPAPLAGLDLSQPITAPAKGTALRLDDWVVRQDGIHTRDGYTVERTLPSSVRSLLSYPGHLIACTLTQIYDGGTLVAGGQTSGDWQAALIANVGGLHLLMANGFDSPRRFNGVSWSVATITGVDQTKLMCPVVHQRRVFAAERGSLRIWYLGVDAIGGPASPIYLEPHCRVGGQVVAIASMSPVGGRTKDDTLVALTDKGELVMFGGSDPDNADGWALQGVWRVPPPVGWRPLTKRGPVLLVMTSKGVLPVPKVLASAESQKPVESLTNPVDKLLSATGSEIIDSGSAELMLIQGDDAQYVLSDTGAWSRWTLDARCWAEHDDALYFGMQDGKVCRYGGSLDDGRPIRSFAVDAFQTLRKPVVKQLHRCRPMYLAAHPYVPRVELLTDYKDPPETFDAGRIDDVYWQWDDVTWPRQPMPWLREVSSELQPWRSLAGKGTAVALMQSVQTRTPIVWTGTQIVYTAGVRV